MSKVELPIDKEFAHVKFCQKIDQCSDIQTLRKTCKDLCMSYLGQVHVSEQMSEGSVQLWQPPLSPLTDPSQSIESYLELGE